MDNFDEDSRYRAADPVLPVTFFHQDKNGEKRDLPGTLVFNEEGLCIAATIEGGGDWRWPDDAPLDAIQFTLTLPDQELLVIRIDGGRVIEHFVRNE